MGVLHLDFTLSNYFLLFFFLLLALELDLKSYCTDQTTMLYDTVRQQQQSGDSTDRQQIHPNDSNTSPTTRPSLRTPKSSVRSRRDGVKIKITPARRQFLCASEHGLFLF